MKKNKTVSIIVILALFMATTAGCASSDNTAVESPLTSESETMEQTGATDSVELATIPPVQTEDQEVINDPGQEQTQTSIQYPLSDHIETFSIAVQYSDMLRQYLTDNDYNDILGLKLAEEATNVHLNVNCVADASVQFPLIIMSGDLPDMFGNVQNVYNGGAESLYNDEVCIDLYPLTQQYAPDYYSFLSTHELYAKECLSDSGLLVSVFTATHGVTNSGIIIRGDWLSDLGLDVPKTYNQFEDVMMAFKNAYEPENTVFLTETPYFANGALIGGMGTAAGYSKNFMGASLLFHVESGMVVMSAIADAQKEYLKMVARWYENGLISQDTLLTDARSQMNAAIGSGNTAVVVGGVDMLNTSTYAEYGDENLSLIGIPDITITGDGVNPVSGSYIGITGNGDLSVTTACKNPEMAVSWINWFWTEMGTMTANFGELGVTYEIDGNGNPYYTDMILDNPVGVPMWVALNNFTVGDSVAKRTMPESIYAQLTSESQSEALDAWASNVSVDGSYFGNMNSEESELYARYAPDLLTLTEEYFLMFVLGERDIDDLWDEYVTTMESMHIDEVLAVKQAAYDRYLSK